MVFEIYQLTSENLILGTISKGKDFIRICPLRCYISSGKCYTIQTQLESSVEQWTDYVLLEEINFHQRQQAKYQGLYNVSLISIMYGL